MLYLEVFIVQSCLFSVRCFCCVVYLPVVFAGGKASVGQDAVAVAEPLPVIWKPLQ